MEREKKRKLEELGGDADAAIQRLMNREELYLKLLRQFAEDPTTDRLERAIFEGNYQEAFAASHTIKGLAATLGLGFLEEEASALTETLRHPPYDEQDIAEDMEKFRCQMKLCRTVIRQL